LTADTSGREGWYAAVAAGLLFGIHPIHAESVAWAAELKDLLCGFFYLLAMITYLRRTVPRREVFTFSILWRGCGSASFACFILALMSKPMAVTLPLVLVILDRFLLQRVDSFRSLLRAAGEKLPFFVAAAVVAGFTVVAQRSGDLVSPEEFVPLTSRLLVASRGFFAYLATICLPTGLSPIYPYPPAAEISITAPVYLLSAGAAAMLLLVIVRTIHRPSWWQGLWLYYFATLLPVLGIIKFGHQYVADRYAYLPSIAPFLALGLGCSWTWEQLSARRPLQLTAAAIALPVAAGLSFLTVQQLSFWRESTVFWTRIIALEPTRLPIAYINRSAAYRSKGEQAKALADVNRAIDLEPGFLGFYNRGLILADAGQTDRAIADFDRAISFLPNDPRAYYNRGLAYWKRGELALALADFGITLAINPDDIRARNDRGLVLQEQGEFAAALAEFNAALTINPDDWMTRNNRGLLYAAKGEPGSAIAEYDRAARLKPDESRIYNNRAIAYAGKGEFPAALEDFTRALRLDPLLAAAYLNRGIVYLKTGDAALARQDFTKACSLGLEAGCGFLR
jgi:Tfp pilus assembly protein PilF